MQASMKPLDVCQQFRTTRLRTRDAAARRARGLRRALLVRPAVVVLTAALAVGACGAQKPRATPTSPPSSTELGRPIGPPEHAVAPTAARIAARRFLDGYLAAVYGRGDIDAIRA